MAKRYGAEFSPNGAQGGVPRNNQGQGGTPPVRLRLMFILPFLFLIGAYFGTPQELILGLGAFAGLILAALATREGLRAEAAFNARVIARRPALPRKALGAVLMAGGLVLGARAGQVDWISAGLLGGLGVVLHIIAFGLDPLRNKGGADSFQSDRVARYVDEAESYLTAMTTAIARLSDRALDQRVDAFAQTARGLFRNVESDPGDLTAARKYLTVYLVGARDASVKFADHYQNSRDSAARNAYETLLGDLETTFASRSQALIGNGKTNLNIEIDVLRERLKYDA
jgi:hypothetical protein